MGVRDIPAFFGARRRVKIGTKSNYNVTALGKQKAENFGLDGPRWQVLAHVAEEGPCSVPEIVKETSLSDQKVKVILKGLISEGYVAPVAGE